MTPDPFDPNFRPPKEGEEEKVGDFFALQEELAATPTPKEQPAPLDTPLKIQRTDFESLGGARYKQVKSTQRRSLVDWLIDVTAPFFILIMVYAVLFFLLDVRYVYTEVHDANLRFVAFCFVLGVVALNRLIARDGSEESMIYMLALAGAIGIYTFSTTRVHEVGSVARNFLNEAPGVATLFNMGVVIFLWWLVNRLTHECCVDENEVAGDVGIMTGTSLHWRRAVQKKGKPKILPAAVTKESRGFFYDTLEPYDPTEDYQVKESPTPARKTPDWAARMPKRHPGISIFFFSLPVFFIFTIGLPVVRHGGDRMVQAGLFYMGIYSVASLMLLMLTSLGGLRQYFRMRKVIMPEAIGWFWMGLGVLMVMLVLITALELPRPDLPGYAHVDEHQIGPWSRKPKTERFSLAEVPADTTAMLMQSKIRWWMGRGVLALFALLLIYSAFKGLLSCIAAIGRDRSRYPRFLVRFFTRLDAFLSRWAHAPRMPARKKRRRIYKSIATSTGFRNSLGDPAKTRMSTQGHIAYAYQALCALAQDLGVDRAKGQTPYEFIEAFPEELHSIREESEEIVRLYVISEYSEEVMNETVLDRLRKFWIVYDRMRNRLVH